MDFDNIKAPPNIKKSGMPPTPPRDFIQEEISSYTVDLDCGAPQSPFSAALNSSDTIYRDVFLTLGFKVQNI